MSQIQCRLERAYDKAYKELERIKAARQKPPEQPQQPEQSTAQTGKEGKKDKFEHPAKLEIAWRDPRTGERQILGRLEHGEPVKEFSSAPPAGTKPPIPPL